jgi:hypothetical protein
MANLTNAGVPVQIGGRDFVVSPLSFGDYEYLEHWYRHHYDKPDFNVLSEGIGGFSNAQGLVQLAYCSLRHETPSLTLDEIRAFDIAEIVNTFFEAFQKSEKAHASKKKGVPPGRKASSKTGTGQPS